MFDWNTVRKIVCSNDRVGYLRLPTRNTIKHFHEEWISLVSEQGSVCVCIPLCGDWKLLKIGSGER